MIFLFFAVAYLSDDADITKRNLTVKQRLSRIFKLNSSIPQHSEGTKNTSFQTSTSHNDLIIHDSVSMKMENKDELLDASNNKSPMKSEGLTKYSEEKHVLITNLSKLNQKTITTSDDICINAPSTSNSSESQLTVECTSSNENSKSHKEICTFVPDPKHRFCCLLCKMEEYENIQAEILNLQDRFRGFRQHFENYKKDIKNEILKSGDNTNAKERLEIQLCQVNTNCLRSLENEKHILRIYMKRLTRARVSIENGITKKISAISRGKCILSNSDKIKTRYLKKQLEKLHYDALHTF